MTRRTLGRSAATLATVGAAALAFAATGQADPNGPKAFYFGADPTGIGSVVLVNEGPAGEQPLCRCSARTRSYSCP